LISNNSASSAAARYSVALASSSGELEMISGVTASSISSESASSTSTRKSPGTVRRALVCPVAIIAALACAGVRSQSVGKWRRRPTRQIEEVRTVLEPTLAAFGYGWDGEAAPQVRGKLWEWLGGGVSAGPRTEPGGLGGLFRVRDRR